jgi:hypothetical protein
LLVLEKKNTKKGGKKKRQHATKKKSCNWKGIMKREIKSPNVEAKNLDRFRVIILHHHHHHHLSITYPSLEMMFR